MAGIDSIDVSTVSTETFGGHADYVEKRELLNDVALILRNGVHPPPLRLPILNKLHRDNEKKWWRYPD